MPGRVIESRDHINVISNMTDGAPEFKGISPASPSINGPPSGTASNANKPTGVHTEDVDGTAQKPSLTPDLKALMQQLPQQVPPLPHITDGYQPLSKLFERAAQECFNGLKDTVANVQDTSKSRMVNGGGPNGVDHEAESTAKRIRWLHFANTSRERFIKLLVLLQWSRSARDDIGQLVSVVSWMRQLSESYDELEDRLGLFKREVSTIKVPSPDINTALEVLTKGESSQMPDLDYIPRQPLSAQKVLQTLRNLDMLLHIRLNVYENLPHQLRNFKIFSGRVSFIVAGEFELDLSIYDEDPSTPFYFLDFRFLFHPCSEIPVGPLRAELERRAGGILASDGLRSCYDFFHDFTLTYKLSILRRQALALARGSWTGTLRVEREHRSLVIQYWVGTSQKKSWVEIGVKSGEVREGAQSWQGDRPSQLFVKWVREGKEAKLSEPMQLNGESLDVELVLESVVQQHIRHLIGGAKDKLVDILNLDGLERNTPRSMDNESEVYPSLPIPRYFSGTAALRIEPISGKFSLSPKSPSTTRCENSLNKLKNPEEELFSKIQEWRAYDGSATFKESAARFGWEVMKSIPLQSDARRQYFGNSTAGLSFIKHWADDKWVVAATPNPLSSFSLWVLNIEEPKKTLWAPEGYFIRHAFSLDTDAVDLSADYFGHVYRLSTSAVSSYLCRNRLSELRIPFTSSTADAPASHGGFPMLCLDVSSITASSAISDRLYISRAGKRPSKTTEMTSDSIVHVAGGRLDASGELKSALSSVKAPDIKFRDDGTFAILDASPSFSPRVMDNIFHTLRHIVQLQTCLESLKQNGFRIVTVSLRSLGFTYPYGKRILQARLVWEKSGAVSLELAPADNPHRRLLPYLQHLLRPTNTSSMQTSVAPFVFRTMTLALCLTLNLLSGLEAIEAQGGALVLVDRPERYKVVYELPRCTMRITHRRDSNRSWWYIDQADNSPRTNEKLQAELKSFLSDTGDGMLGLGKGMAVEPGVISTVLGNLDRRIRACADGEERRPRPKREDESKEPPGTGTKAAAPAKKEEKGQAKTQPKKQQAKADQAPAKTNSSTANGAKGKAADVVVLD